MEGQQDERRLVELDNRRRVALGKVARPQDTRYFATLEADGVIILTPAVVVPLVPLPPPRQES
jgi:hypothetical protein